ncbi:Post-GPI attachment to proteins factor 2 [Lamellibrachia satsuma]|nr:Post-GPI attachment to proteins factor 2 [Lamellibrachia satsuma]
MAPGENRRASGVLFHVSTRFLSLGTVFLPTFAFFTCVALSIIYDYEPSTRTHCKVRNYLPSISAAIGGFTPQRYIWRICIALHCWPRFLGAIVYRNYYLSYQVYEWRLVYNLLANLACLLNIVENFALVTLTYISSSENYPMHEASFIVFMMTSEVYMLCSCILYKWSHMYQTFSPMERKSFRLKLSLMVFNVSCFLLAIYFFFRHNTYCEPGVYTMFAFLEYMVVLSNIAFHATFITNQNVITYTYFALFEYMIVLSNIAFHGSGLWIDLQHIEFVAQHSSAYQYLAV